jgi:ribonuclease P protein component
MSLPPGVRPAPRLGPAEGISSKRDFARLRKEGRRGGDRVLRVLVASNGLGYSRVASAVPKRYGKAVVRNRLRRLFRDAFRLEKPALPQGYDVLLSPARDLSAPRLEQVRASLVSCVRKVVSRLERRARPGAQP